jgi:hypothetical protein
LAVVVLEVRLEIMMATMVLILFCQLLPLLEVVVEQKVNMEVKDLLVALEAARQQMAQFRVL